MNTYFKFLSRNKFYTFVTVFGFAVSLMFVFLIAVYVKQELSVDKFQEKADRIYFLGDGEAIRSAYRVAERIQERYPEIETVVPMLTTIRTPVDINNEKFNAKTILVERNFFDVFSFSLLEGNKEHVFDTRASAVISESFARKVFPDREPLGEVITYEDSVLVTVSGVMKDIKNSAIPYADVLIRIDNAKYFNPGYDSPTFDNYGGAVLAILVKPGADIQAKSEDMSAYFKEIIWVYERGMSKNVSFSPMRDFYFGDIRSNDLLEQGDKSFVLILMTVGIVILLFAIFNYVNLTVAQTGFRAREMATRSLVGANPEESFWRLTFESVLLNFISLAIGILFAFLCAPYVSDLLGTQLYLADFFTLTNTILLISLVIILGVISGIFPAYLISKFKSIDVVKGNFRLKNKMVFSKVFIVIQNVLTIALIAASVIIARQVNYLIHAPLGYNYKNIITVDNNIGGYEDFQPLVSELEALASVKRLTFSQGTPFDGGNNYTFPFNGRNIQMQILTGDSIFFNMLGFEILRDNHADKRDYLTEQSYLELELEDDAVSIPFDQSHSPYYHWSLGGKIRNFQMHNIIAESRPAIVSLRNRDQYYPWNLFIETQGDPKLAFNQVKQTYEKITGLEFEGQFIEDAIAHTFSAQQRLLKIIIIFSGIAILISLLGLMAISTYFIRQRVREIALRKALGSNNLQIMSQLILSFLMYVGIAFMLATPVIWFLMKNWLEDYTYRIMLSPVYFIAAGLFCLFISFVTVFFQSYQAATANPVNALKNE